MTHSILNLGSGARQLDNVEKVAPKLNSIFLPLYRPGTANILVLLWEYLITAQQETSGFGFFPEKKKKYEMSPVNLSSFMQIFVFESFNFGKATPILKWISNHGYLIYAFFLQLSCHLKFKTWLGLL